MPAESMTHPNDPAKLVSARARKGLVALGLFTFLNLNAWLLCSFPLSTAGSVSQALPLASVLRRGDARDATKQFQPRRTHLFTLADTPQHQVCLLAAGVAQYGYKLNVFAWNQSEHFADGSTCGEPCTLQQDVMKAHERKVYWQHNLAQKYADYGIHDDDLIVFVDAYDVLVQSDPGRIADLFVDQTRHQRGVVFNGEPKVSNALASESELGDKLRDGQYEVQLTTAQGRVNVSGHDLWKMMAPKTLLTATINGPMFSLNSGIFIGDALTLRSLFQRVLDVRDTMTDGFRGDQILFQLAYLRYPEINVLVDAAASISYVFSFLYSTGDIDLLTASLKGDTVVPTCHAAEYLTAATPGAKVHYTVDTEPVFLHFPGKSKPLYSDTCAQPAWEAIANAVNVSITFLRDFDRGTDIPLSSFCHAPAKK